MSTCVDESGMAVFLDAMEHYSEGRVVISAVGGEEPLVPLAHR